MLFNADKCKIMHFGYNNTMANYKLNDKNLEVTKEKCDLGVIMPNDLKCRLQCMKTVNTASPRNRRYKPPPLVACEPNR